VPRSHARAICDELERRGAPVPWICYASPASLDDETVGKLARAGCIGAEIGTDSGTKAGLLRLGKLFDLDDVRRVRASFARHHVFDAHTFVLGSVGETVDDVRDTLDFVVELDPDVAIFLVFMEDREERGVGHSPDRAAILDLLADVTPKRPRWIVPELEIRFGQKVTNITRRKRMRGPTWVHLARARR